MKTVTCIAIKSVLVLVFLLSVQIVGGQAQCPSQLPPPPAYQYDETTQPMVLTNLTNVKVAATCNIGQFIVGSSGSTLRLIGNSGNIISQTNSFTSEVKSGDNGIIVERNIAIACNHNSEVAIAGFFIGIDGQTHLGIKILKDINTKGQISLSTKNIPNILSPSLPTSFDGDFVLPGWHSGQNYRIADCMALSAAMNDAYVYLTWKAMDDLTISSGNSSMGYFFAVFELSTNSWKITPKNIFLGNGSPAGSDNGVSTVACDRWTNTDGARIAFTAQITYDADDGNGDADGSDDGFHSDPFYFIPNTTNINQQPFAQNLLKPALVTDCYFVRVVNYDERTSTSGFHYFYCFIKPDQNGGQASLPLFSCTDATDVSNPNCVSNAISQNIQLGNPVYHMLEAGLGFDNIIPTPGCGNGYTDHSVYFSYVEGDLYCNGCPIQPATIKVCRQWGWDQHTIWSPNSQGWHPNDQVQNITLGCNQMGLFSLFQTTSAPTFRLWRDFRPFAQNIYENTLASGLCKIEPVQWHQEAFNQIEVRVFPTETSLANGVKADTLRIFHDGNLPNGAPSQLFKFEAPNFPTNPALPSLSSGVAFNANSIAANWNAGNRGHIIMENGSNIDFNNKVDAQIPPAGIKILAHSNGSIDYQGSNFLNMKNSMLGAVGNLNPPNNNAIQDSNLRGIIYMNAPCQINNGSGLISEKGQIEFKYASDQPGTALFSTTGAKTFINFDQSWIFLGSKNPDHSLIQIQMNGNTTTNVGEYCSITYSTLIIPGRAGNYGYASYRSDIKLLQPDHASFTHNQFYDCDIIINNPIGNIDFSTNHGCYALNKQIELYWLQSPDKYQGQITVNSNWIYTVNDSFQNGYGTEDLKAIIVSGFDMLPLNKVQIFGNALVNYGNWAVCASQQLGIGISLENGTNADVSQNTIMGSMIGISTQGLGTATPLICSNKIWNGCGCPSVSGATGVLQDANKGFTRNNEIYYLDIGYQSTGTDVSVLLHNNIHDNYRGVVLGYNSYTLFNGSHNGGDDFAGYNNFVNNTVTQIEIPGGCLPLHSHFGDQSNGGDLANYGKNIFSTPTGAKHMKNANDAYASNNSTLTELTGNQWSPDIKFAARNGSLIPYINNEPTMPLMIYQNVSNVYNITLPTLGCTGSPSIIVHKQEPLSVAPQVTDDSLADYNQGMKIGTTNSPVALSLMRKYSEEHPYATVYPGEVLEALLNTLFYTGQLTSPGFGKWIEEYNWLVKMQPVNMEREFQKIVINVLGQTLRNYDRNGGANMWYNYSVLFSDSNDVAEAWKNIKQIRYNQQLRGEDTTAFYLLHFPLSPSGLKMSTSGMLSFTINPNPSKGIAKIAYFAPKEGNLIIGVYDILGNEKVVITSSIQSKGNGIVELNLMNLTQGIYYIRASLNGQIVSLKLILTE